MFFHFWRSGFYVFGRPNSAVWARPTNLLRVPGTQMVIGYPKNLGPYPLSFQPVSSLFLAGSSSSMGSSLVQGHPFSQPEPRRLPLMRRDRPMYPNEVHFVKMPLLRVKAGMTKLREKATLTLINRT